MRLSANHIRSINRAIARVQSSAWSEPNRILRCSSTNSTLAVSQGPAKFVKVVVVPKSATL
jgi:hypothetical protein